MTREITKQALEAAIVRNCSPMFVCYFDLNRPLGTPCELSE